ncbi:MAG TPA: HlyD family efflux transporter periplasmic adaptor subunit, partial [Gemmatimonadaceae bacterium]|nr:HlyD family efflux transporter periplasmic adaptor subunit [Gemmatimonadaceae bacterium]
MPRELRGVGELAPQDDASRWVSAELDGRVDRKLLERGAIVSADTIILQLSNRDVEQAAVEARLELEAAEAAYSSLEATLRTDLLALRSQSAAIDAEESEAALQAEVDSKLAKDGLLAELTSRQSEVRKASLAGRAKLEQDRVRNTEASVATRLATQHAEVERRRTLAQLKRHDLESMTVRAGMTGVLQDIVVEVGQRVSRNANLARVVDPSRLKAVIRIPEAQTHDLHINLPASIDTHSGVIRGRVSRIAPSAQNGTVTIDVELSSALPPGARPDMTVDGTVELERLSNVRHMGRPSSGQTEGAVTVFKLSSDGAEAKRVSVRLGRASANEVEILEGDLRPGDRVVLSDASQWTGD